jgi:hypothetical protein
MDSTAPTIDNVMPIDGDLALSNTPLISAVIEDPTTLATPSGIDPTSIVITLDGTPVSYQYTPELNSVIYTPPESLTDGSHYVVLSVEDKANNKTIKSWSFRVDATPPTTIGFLTPGASNGLNGWYVTPVGICLSASDNDGGSGVDKTEFSLDAGLTWQTYSAPFVISAQGEKTVLYHSIDNANNTESNQSISFKIDSAAPEVPSIVSPQDGVSVDNPVRIEGTSEPEANVSIVCDNSSVTNAVADSTGSWQVDITLSEGPHVVTATATDEAGNTSPPSNASNVTVRYGTTVSIDSTSPGYGQYSDQVALKAALSSAQGPLAGKLVKFKIGMQELTATTDSTGVAATEIPLNQPAGIYDLEVGFAGDSTYRDSYESSPFAIEKEDIILTYIGDVLAPTTGTAILKASVLDSDNGAPISDTSVHLKMGGTSLSALTDSTGTATSYLVINQSQGIYQAQAVFDGNGYYNPATSLPSYFVIFDPISGQKATGGGWVTSGVAKSNFGFDAYYVNGASTPTGDFQFTDHGTGMKIHSLLFSWLIFTNNTATLEGTCTVNNASGYRFHLEVTDVAEPGKDKDKFKLTVYDSLNNVAYSIDRVINQGNIQGH